MTHATISGLMSAYLFKDVLPEHPGYQNIHKTAAGDGGHWTICGQDMKNHCVANCTWKLMYVMNCLAISSLCFCILCGMKELQSNGKCHLSTWFFSQDVLTENAEDKDWTGFDIILWNALFGHYMAVEWKEVHAEDSETHTSPNGIAITGDAMYVV